MSWFGLWLSTSEKENFDNFQENRRPSMCVVGRGTLTMSLDAAHEARKEKNRQKVTQEDIKKDRLNY